MRWRPRRWLCGALIVAPVLIGVFAVSAAKAVEHACCREPARSIPAPAQPCQGLVALACCQTAALPEGVNGSQRTDAPIALAPASRAFVALVPAIQRVIAAAPTPAPSPHRLSVVLLL